MSRDRRLPRIERIERALAGPSPRDGPLNRLELAELAAFDRWHDQEFGGRIVDWPDEKVQRYLQHERGLDGRAQRYDELRQRDQSPERKEADHRRLAEHLGIEPSEVKGYLARAIAELTGARGT